MSATHGPVTLGNDSLFLAIFSLEVGETQLLSDHGNGRDPIDTEEQGGSGDPGKGDPDEQSDPKTLQTHVAFETEEGSDRKTLTMESGSIR